MKTKLTLLSAATSLLVACTVGPDYQRPTVDAGSGWSKPPDAATVPAPELSRWWTIFSDPTLDQLIDQALTQNLDVREAAARIEESRALRAVAAGGYWPEVHAQGGVTRRRQSENGPIPIASIPLIERNQTIYDAGFDANWEIDLFGHTRRAVEAADARVGGAVASAIGVRLAVTAEVARSYVAMRGAQNELEARTQAVNAARTTLDLVRMRVQAGDEPEASSARAEAELTALQARLPAVQAEVRAGALGIGLLLGELPEAEVALADSRTATPALAALPVGERADLLRRRPDVYEAERRLAATTADVGVQTAELFPRLAIGANAGFEALDADDLFQSESEQYSIAPFISWRIFDGGRVRASIRASDARAQQAALAYERTVLAALNDAERALTRYELALEGVARQHEAVRAARRSYEFADTRYREGDIALFDLLDVERTLRDAEAGLAIAQTNAATGLVALFKALGGGWTNEDEAALRELGVATAR
jgi:NodT family efflux transporter outer membrane factor (OMF) lipoprotein